MKKQSGQVLVLVIAAMAVVLFTVLFIVAGAQLYFQNASYTADSEKAVALAEAGIDKAVASLNKIGDTYNGESGTQLGDGSYSVEITSKDAATKTIKATGYIPNKENPKVRRTVTIQASKGVGISFVYGVQVGDGGLQLGNSNTIKGSIYSNGNITAVNSNTIEGDAWVAGGAQSNPDQETDCEGSNCQDYLFGKSISGENRLDIAQSFKMATSGVLTKVSLKVKKFGLPADVTVRILGDDSGKPDKNNVLATGTLYSSLVVTSYGWIDVTFTSSPNLIADTAYWLMLDTSSNSSNYWSWQNDLAQSYNRGSPKWSSNWSTGNPAWTNITGDLSFKTYVGGVNTSFRGGNSDKVKGNVHANTIDNLKIEGDAYYQTITDTQVDGTSYPGSEDPPPKVFPISEANIASWKEEAEDAGVTEGDITNCVSTLEGKYIGNLDFGNSCNVTIKSPVWVTGNFTLNNSNNLKLDRSSGTASGLIIVDGISEFGNSNKLEGTGEGSSILMLLSTYDSTGGGIAAIQVPNSGNSGVLYANKGIIEPGNSNEFKELTAWGIRLMNSTTITYETGLSSTLFSSGPTGAYSLIKGTYQVK